MITTVRPDLAGDLIFEYVAATEVEQGRRPPASPADLPLPLRAECDDPRSAYPPPGTVLVAQRSGHPIGCVALSRRGPTTGEVKRLYVRPAHRGGVGRELMRHLHEHAARHGLTHLVLDVLPTRRHAIALYRDLGYVEITPPAPGPLLLMERRGSPGA